MTRKPDLRSFPPQKIIRWFYYPPRMWAAFGLAFAVLFTGIALDSLLVRILGVAALVSAFVYGLVLRIEWWRGD